MVPGIRGVADGLVWGLAREWSAASSGSVGKGTIRTHIFDLLCHELSHDPTTVIIIRL
jgi:hypothetical protein